MFDVATCRDYAEAGRLDDWVERYLSAGPWANTGLRDGLRLQRRYWLGPLLVTLDQLERCCGPEPDMTYRVDAEDWRRKLSQIASQLSDPTKVPPLIVEWQSGVLNIRDGNHRHGAMVEAGWTAGWAIVWCNSPADFAAARESLDAPRSAPTSDSSSGH